MLFVTHVTHGAAAAGWGLKPQPGTESAFKLTRPGTRLNGFAIAAGEFIHPLALCNVSYTVQHNNSSNNSARALPNASFANVRAVSVKSEG